MKSPINLIRNCWRKNWPEVHCGLTGGLPGFVLKKKPKPIGDSVPVFCYHVIDEPTFRADLAYLCENGYNSLTADGLLDHLEQRHEAPPKSVVLSFDDGQRTLYDVAFPLLKEYNHRAVAFICPGLHREVSDEDAEPDGGLCSWDQIRQMHAGGVIDFQPHTDSHRSVSAWPRPLPLAGIDDAVADARRPGQTKLEADLRRAKATLDEKLGKFSRHLAFPQYNGSEKAIHMARQIGYSGFFWGVLPGRATNRPGDPAERIVRISGEFVRRLPGIGRVTLAQVMRRRYRGRF